MRSVVTQLDPNVRVGDPQSDPKTESRDSEDLLRDLWQLSRDLCLHRLLVVESAVRACAAGQLDAQLREEGVRQAHNLVGSLGLFGLTDAAEMARTLERLLDDDQQDPRRLEQAVRQVKRLRRGLRKASSADPFSPARPAAADRPPAPQPSLGSDRPVATPERTDSPG